MSKLYKRVAPHLQRIAYDAVDPATKISYLKGGDNIQDLLLLQRNNEELKDYIKVAFCPELYGNKIRTSGINNFITKGYSANSIQREFGQELIPYINGTFSIDNDPYWGNTHPATITILNGKCNFNSTPQYNNIIKGGVLSVGKDYEVAFDVIDYVSGTIRVYVGDNNSGAITISNGQKVKIKLNSGNSTSIAFAVASTTSTYSIDNISVREVLSNDLTQTSSTNQPYLDKVSPNERLSAKNPNGDDCYLTHPTVSFGANDEWTMETVFNIYSVKTDYCIIINNLSYWVLAIVNSGSVSYRDSGTLLYFVNTNIKQFFGKNITITLVNNTSGILSCYVNGVFTGVLASAKSGTVTFNQVLNGDVNRGTNGTISSHHIFSKALSATQIAERASILRSIFPEIPFTRIGEQIWSVRNYEAVVTPQGNLIAEVQANANVEKITNVADREFTSDTGFWTKTDATTIDNADSNICNINSPTGALSKIERSNLLTVGKYYKLQYTILRIGSGFIDSDYAGGVPLSNSLGVNTIYFTANSTMFNIKRRTPGQITDIDIDNVSLTEIGWSGSQELYDGIYAQTAEAASSVEKISNVADRDFSSDTGWWSRDNINTVIGGGYCTIKTTDGSNARIYKANQIVVGRWYKLSYTILANRGGSLKFQDFALNSNVGSYTVYALATTTDLSFGRFGGPTDIDIDNISVKELGLSDATSIANYTYAAVKAAAMWRNCQNTTDSAAVYGKEYNKYAAKLLAMDINYYNANNPTTPWGWRVSLKADNDILALNGGNALKAVGNAYWNNSNGTNSTGFTALGGGIINTDGTNSALKTNMYLLCSDADVAREIKDSDNTCNEVAITTQGGSIRLIKTNTDNL